MSDLVQVRKFLLLVEETLHDGGPRADNPPRRAAICAVIRNPYAGKYVEDILPLMEALKPLGMEMARSLVDALGGDPAVVQAYGKGTIIGADGELEHGALWHAPGGYSMRELIGARSKAIVPSSTKVAGLGARLDVPFGHVQAAYVRSHFDAMEVGVPDGPRADEIVLILAMASGGRVHARAGGLQASEIKGEDGNR